MDEERKLDGRLRLCYGSLADSYFQILSDDIKDIVQPSEGKYFKIEKGKFFHYNGTVLIADEDFFIRVGSGDSGFINERGEFLGISSPNTMMYGKSKDGEIFTPYDTGKFEGLIDEVRGSEKLVSKPFIKNNADAPNLYSAQSTNQLAEELKSQDNVEEVKTGLTEIKIPAGRKILLRDNSTTNWNSSNSAILGADKEITITIPKSEASNVVVTTYTDYDDNGNEITVPKIISLGKDVRFKINASTLTLDQLTNKSQEIQPKPVVVSGGKGINEQFKEATKSTLGVELPLSAPVIAPAAVVATVATPLVISSFAKDVPIINIITKTLEESFMVGAFSALGVKGKGIDLLVRRGNLIGQAIDGKDKEKLSSQAATEAIQIATEYATKNAPKYLEELEAILGEKLNQTSKIDKIALKSVEVSKKVTEWFNSIGQSSVKLGEKLFAPAITETAVVEEVASLTDEVVNVADDAVKAAPKGSFITRGLKSAGTKLLEAVELLAKSKAVQVLGKGSLVLAPVVEASVGGLESFRANSELANREGKTENEINDLKSTRAKGFLRMGGAVAIGVVAAFTPVGWAALIGYGIYTIADLGLEVVSGKSAEEHLMDYAYGVKDPIKAPKKLNESQDPKVILASLPTAQETTGVKTNLSLDKPLEFQDDSKVISDGNLDQRVLAAAYKALANSGSGMTDRKFEKLDYLDRILGDAMFSSHDYSQAKIGDKSGDKVFNISSDKLINTKYGSESTFDIKGIKSFNEDVIILASVYEAFMKNDGKLSGYEKNKLKYLDEKLGGVEIKFDGGDINIVDNTNKPIAMKSHNAKKASLEMAL